MIARGRIFVILAILVTAFAVPAMAQSGGGNPAFTTTDDLSDVRLFQGWVTDATFTPGIDLEPAFRWQKYGSVSSWFAGARVAVWARDLVEVGGGIGTAGTDGESGISDTELYGRMRIPVEGITALAIGADAQLPTGDPLAGQNNQFVRIFGAMRQGISGGAMITGNAGFEWLELDGEDSTGLFLGGGLLVPMSRTVTAIGELNLKTSLDYAVLTGGADYELPPGGHLRASLGIGLDTQAPDLTVEIALALPIF